MNKIKAKLNTIHCQKYKPAGWHRSGSALGSLHEGIVISNCVNVYEMTKTNSTKKPKINLKGRKFNMALVTKKELKGTRLMAPINRT